MALEMNEPLAGQIAQFGILGFAKGVVPGPDPINRVEASAIAQVNGDAVVPVQAIGIHPSAQQVLCRAIVGHVPAGASGFSNSAKLSIASP